MMLGRGVGLVGLVEMARESAGLDSAEFITPAEAADEVCRYVLCGQYRMACALADLEREYYPDHLSDSLNLLYGWVNWWAFAESVHLAAQIDDFLATLEGDERTAALARDCRGEVDLLRVLADLCEDSGLQRSAREARYLHGLTMSLCVDLWATKLNGAPPLPPAEEPEME